MALLEPIDGEPLLKPFISPLVGGFFLIIPYQRITIPWYLLCGQHLARPMLTLCILILVCYLLARIQCLIEGIPKISFTFGHFISSPIPVKSWEWLMFCPKKVAAPLWARVWGPWGPWGPPAWRTKASTEYPRFPVEPAHLAPRPRPCLWRSLEKGACDGDRCGDSHRLSMGIVHHGNHWLASWSGVCGMDRWTRKLCMTKTRGNMILNLRITLVTRDVETWTLTRCLFFVMPECSEYLDLLSRCLWNGELSTEMCWIRGQS